MKKIISLILALVTIFSLTTPCFALEEQKSSIEEAVALAEELYPGAEIHIDKQGTLHIFVDIEVGRAAARVSQIYAPEGGRFHHFIRPALTDPYVYTPLSIVFLPHEEVEALSIALENEDLFNDIIEKAKEIGGEVLTASAINEIIQAIKYGLILTAAGVLFYISQSVYSAIDWVDRYQFNQAREKYYKLCIQQLTLRGNIANVYTGWSGNYVSAAPYDDWNPMFTEGDYTFY